MSDQGWGTPPGAGGGWGQAPQGPPAPGAPMDGLPVVAPPIGGPPGTPNQLAIVSLVAGAISVMSSFCCCIPVLGFVAYFVVPVAGLAAVATGVLALQEANKTGVGRNESIVGIALGSVGVLMGLFGVAMLVLYGGMMAYGAATQ